LSSARTQSDSADSELIRAVARRDERAFANLYDIYSSILFGLLLRILHSRAEAEDVLQEVFLQVWQQAHAFDASRGRPFTWLVTLARSRAIDRLRSLESRDRAAQKSAVEPTEGGSGDAVADAIRSEQREIVQSALAEIPDEQRRALMLAYLEGMTQTEIAAKLGQPLGTVKTRTRSGLLKLNELLRDRLGAL
jgi:RNA polymerase sigma-70 factor (ECF subfamily)